MLSFKRTVSGCAAILSVIGLSFTGLSPALAATDDVAAEAFFTLENLANGSFDLSGSDSLARSSNISDDAGYAYALSGSGPGAVIDAGLLEKGALSAAGTNFVDISWEGPGVDRTYRIIRDDVALALTEERTFRDKTVTAGSSYSYRVETVLPTETTKVPEEEVTIRGFEVTVPADGDVANAATMMSNEVLATSNLYGTQLLYRTFIPMPKVDGPPAGCTYNAPYQYGGDNRGYVTGGLASFRTLAAANIQWPSNGLMTTIQNGATHVYKSNGTHYTSKTQNTKDMWIKQLARTSSYADLRVSVKSPNPFCGWNSIQGAFTISITRNGSYAISSGSHRQMPSHEVYVMGSTTGIWKTVYRRDYASLACLISMACPTATMSGSGSY